MNGRKTESEMGFGGEFGMDIHDKNEVKRDSQLNVSDDKESEKGKNKK